MFKWKLEIEKYKEQIIRSVKRNKTVIIRGPTGCGKSTYVPLLFKDKNVAIIEPRRIAVLGLYNVLKDEIGNIGYKMRFNKKKTDEKVARTVIYTDGAFLAEMDLDYDVIIVDEVHERSVRTDVLLMILREKYKHKLILMSATLDTSALTEYFAGKLVEIRCKSHSITINYLDKPTADYIIEAFLTIKKIIKNGDEQERRDILVFLSGIDDIADLYKMMLKIPLVRTYRMFSAMEEAEQIKIFDKTAERKVILTTNVCETSLTIPSVKYVIDAGVVKNKVYSGINYLGIQPISKESALQRMGRCNRLGSGIVYKLYTKDEKMAPHTPEILRTDVTTAVLLLLNYGLNLKTVKFLAWPNPDNLKEAILFLQDKKCIEYKTEIFRITSYGKRVVAHPFDVQLSTFYEETVTKGLAYYGSIITSMISLENYNFMLFKEKEQKTDFDYLIFLFEEYKKTKDKDEFTRKYQVNKKAMEMAYKIFRTLKKGKISENGLEKAQQIFSKCFEHNLCIRQNDGSYQVNRTGQRVYIHPSSPFFKRNINKIVAVDFFYTTRAYCRIVGRYFGISIF